MNIYATIEQRPTVQEHAEAISAGLMSTIKTLEDLLAKHPREEFDCIANDLDQAIDRCTDLWVAATKVKRRKDCGLEP